MATATAAAPNAKGRQADEGTYSPLVGQLLSVMSSYKPVIRWRGLWFTGNTLVASVLIDHSGYALVPYKNEATRV